MYLVLFSWCPSGYISQDYNSLGIKCLRYGALGCGFQSYFYLSRKSQYLIVMRRFSLRGLASTKLLSRIPEYINYNVFYATTFTIVYEVWFTFPGTSLYGLKVLYHNYNIKLNLWTVEWKFVYLFKNFDYCKIPLFAVSIWIIEAKNIFKQNIIVLVTSNKYCKFSVMNIIIILIFSLNMETLC